MRTLEERVAIVSLGPQFEQPVSTTNAPLTILGRDVLRTNPDVPSVDSDRTRYMAQTVSLL